MPSIKSLVRKLETDFPDFTFIVAEDFLWTPATSTVSYNPSIENAEQMLLHELSHGILGHSTYARDIELLTLESAAWAKAREIATNYDSVITEQVAEDNIDTYREWLHARSTCPECTATGVQVKESVYECPACTNSWRVNEARLCGLKRYRIKD